jgi:hypothetical protein
LISSEDLCDLNQQEIERLKGFTQGIDTTIVIYVRRWSERLLSAWKESIHHGAALTFPHFAAAHLANPTASNQMNMATLVQSYCNVFGRSNIRLVSYDRLVENKIDIADHYFKNILGLRHDRSIVSHQIHVSLDARNIELGRALNSIDNRLGIAYLAQIERVDTSRILEAMKSHQDSITLDETDRLWSMAQSEFYGEFGDLFVEPKPRHLEPVVKQIRYVTPGYLVEPGIAEAIRGLRHILASSS